MLPLTSLLLDHVLGKDPNQWKGDSLLLITQEKHRAARLQTLLRFQRRRARRQLLPDFISKNAAVLQSRYYGIYRAYLAAVRRRKQQLIKVEEMAQASKRTLGSRYYLKAHFYAVRRRVDREKHEYPAKITASVNLALTRRYYAKLADLDSIRAAKAEEAKRVAREIRAQVELQRSRIEAQRVVRLGRPVATTRSSSGGGGDRVGTPATDSNSAVVQARVGTAPTINANTIVARSTTVRSPTPPGPQGQGVRSVENSPARPSSQQGTPASRASAASRGVPVVRSSRRVR